MEGASLESLNTFLGTITGLWGCPGRPPGVLKSVDTQGGQAYDSKMVIPIFSSLEIAEGAVRMRIFKCLAVFVGIVVLAGTLAAQTVGPAEPVSPTAPKDAEAVNLPEGVVATVNGEPITESEWLDTLKRVAGRGILEVMIRHKVVQEAAAKQGITISKSEVEALFDKQAASVGGVSNLMVRLQQMGEPMQEYKRRLRTETLLHRMAEKGVTVTDDEIEKFFREKYGRKAEVQVIVTGTKEDAEDALAKIAAGEDFAQVAAAKSIDKRTAGNHAYIPALLSEGFFPKNFGGVVITQALAEKIFKLKVGSVSGIMPGARQSFYIFKLTRLIPASDVKLESVKDSIRKDAMEFKVRNREGQILQQLVNAAVIKRGI